jgi:hypothetical protein
MEFYRLWGMGGSSHHSLVWLSSAAATYGRYKAKTWQIAIAVPKPLNSLDRYPFGARSIELERANPRMTKYTLINAIFTTVISFIT